MRVAFVADEEEVDKDEEDWGIHRDTIDDDQGNRI